MDEPTSSLDLYRQLEIFNLIREITWSRGMITLVAIHDLNLAARYADRIVVMDKGRIYATGEPSEILTPEMINTVYNVKADVYLDMNDLPVVVPKVSASQTRNTKKKVNTYGNEGSYEARNRFGKIMAIQDKRHQSGQQSRLLESEG